MKIATPRPAGSRSRPSSRRSASSGWRCGGFAAVSGRTQSLHATDLLPRARLYLRRSASADRPAHAARFSRAVGVADGVDPFAGSYFIEALTDEIEARVGADGEGRAAPRGSVNAPSSSSARSRSRRSLSRALPPRPRTSSSGSTSTSPRPRTTSRCSRSTRSPKSAASRAAGGVQVESRPGTGRRATSRICARWRARTKSALPDQGRTPRRRVDRRGLRRDARCVRRVPRGGVLLMRTPRGVLAHRAIDA